jgi:hypothetical protein
LIIIIEIASSGGFLPDLYTLPRLSYFEQALTLGGFARVFSDRTPRSSKPSSVS